MALKLYNSLSHQREDFVSLEPGKVKMYTCGPTVYHFAHIGNLRTYIMEDVLEKYLGYVGYNVHRVMNITDVGHLSSDADTGEDKMLKGAKREHKSVMEIAKFYTDAFFSDCDKLNIKKPEVVQPAASRSLSSWCRRFWIRAMLTRRGETSILTPPSWRNTTFSTTTTRKTWKWASGKA